jgi:hypothetical protein
MQTTAHIIQNLRRLDPEWLACSNVALEVITSRWMPLQHVTSRRLQLRHTEMITKIQSKSAVLVICQTGIADPTTSASLSSDQSA